MFQVYSGQTFSVIEFGDNPELDTYVRTVDGKPVFTSRRTQSSHITHIDMKKIEEIFPDLEERKQKNFSIKRKFPCLWFCNPKNKGFVIENLSQDLIADLKFCLGQFDGTNFAIHHDGSVQLDLRRFKTVRINSIENVLINEDCELIIDHYVYMKSSEIQVPPCRKLTVSWPAGEGPSLLFERPDLIESIKLETNIGPTMPDQHDLSNLTNCKYVEDAGSIKTFPVNVETVRLAHPKKLLEGNDLKNIKEVSTWYTIDGQTARFLFDKFDTLELVRDGNYFTRNQYVYSILL